MCEKGVMTTILIIPGTETERPYFAKAFLVRRI